MEEHAVFGQLGRQARLSRQTEFLAQSQSKLVLMPAPLLRLRDALSCVRLQVLLFPPEVGEMSTIRAKSSLLAARVPLKLGQNHSGRRGRTKPAVRGLFRV